MSLVFVASSMIPSSCFNQHKVNQSSSLNPCFFFVHGKYPSCITENIHTIFRKKALGTLRFTRIERMTPNSQSNEENMIYLDSGDEEKEVTEDSGSPWEGAVIYRRNASVSHVEYCTTLERLGLGKLSTEVSRSRASVMGLRLTKAVKDYPFGTPVHVSVDITKKKQKLRLDGIIKTVITLGCNRYSIFVNQINCYYHGTASIFAIYYDVIILYRINFQERKCSAATQ